MTWKHYPLTFRLLSPLRIGWREAGNLLITRPYVTGRVLWGALTTRLTRDLGQGDDGQAYEKVGKALQDSMRFGYLWPSTNPPEPCYPWKTPDFDYIFLSSYVSTAQNANVGSAEDNSLHEAEFIAPHTRRGEAVYLVGSLWVRDDCPCPEWQSALKQVQLGGERHYGWGRVRLKTPLQPAMHRSIQDPDNFLWEGPIPAHLSAPMGTHIPVQGELEPLVGWETDRKGRKRIRPAPQVAYRPGARVFPPGNRFAIGRDGVWEIVQGKGETHGS